MAFTKIVPLTIYWQSTTHCAASDSETERLAESGAAIAEKIPNNLSRLERAMKLNLLSVIKQLPFLQHFLMPHCICVTAEQPARVCTQAKKNTVTVRSCTECASRVLAGDARSIAGEAHSYRIGKASDCEGGGQNEIANTQTPPRRRLCRSVWMLRLGMPPPRNACAPQPSRARNGTTKQNFSHCQQYYGSFVFPPIPFVSAQGEMEGRSRDLLQRHSLRKGERKAGKKKATTFLMSGSRLAEK